MRMSVLTCLQRLALSACMVSQRRCTMYGLCKFKLTLVLTYILLTEVVQAGQTNDKSFGERLRMFKDGSFHTSIVVFVKAQRVPCNDLVSSSMHNICRNSLGLEELTYQPYTPLSRVSFPPIS